MASTFVVFVSGLASRACAFFWCVWVGAAVAALRFVFGTWYWHCSCRFFVVGFEVTLRAFNLENHGVSGAWEGRGSSVSTRGGIDSSRRNCVPQVLQWDLYQAVIHTWALGHVPQAWLQSRISLLYTKGRTRSATNYRPISVNHYSLYVILTKLILNAIQHPLDASLSPHQYGSRKGHTPTKQAIQLLTTLSSAEESVICLLDIAKAFPSTPHDSIHTALELIGTPQTIRTLIKSIYQGSTNQYQDYHYKLTRGIKEGCPLSPSLFVLLYEAFHATLCAEFPDVQFFTYVDDIAVSAPNVHVLRRVFQRIDTLPPTVGFRVNRDKTELYH